MKTYKGIDIFNVDKNASGLKYYARTSKGILKADTLQGIKGLISETIQLKG